MSLFFPITLYIDYYAMGGYFYSYVYRLFNKWGAFAEAVVLYWL